MQARPPQAAATRLQGIQDGYIAPVLGPCLHVTKCGGGVGRGVKRGGGVMDWNSRAGVLQAAAACLQDVQNGYVAPILGPRLRVTECGGVGRGVECGRDEPRCSCLGASGRCIKCDSVELWGAGQSVGRQMCCDRYIAAQKYGTTPSSKEGHALLTDNLHARPHSPSPWGSR